MPVDKHGNYINYSKPEEDFRPLNNSGRRYDPKDFKGGKNPLASTGVGNKNSVGNKGGGRPSDYDPDYHIQKGYQLTLLGCTDAQIASIFDIAEGTLQDWKERHPDFCAALMNGKDIADAQVAEKLYQRAIGFEHDDEEIKVVALGMNMGSQVERVPVRKIYAPDPIAAQFWLNNRQKDKWRSQKHIDQTTDGESLNKGFYQFLKETSIDLDQSESE